VNGPPVISVRLLEAVLPPEYREQQLGDLEEEFGQRLALDGRAAAARWYRRQALRSIAPALKTRLRPRPRHVRPMHPRGTNTMETLLQDIRYGVRSLLKNPSFAAVSTTTLALAIGVNTAIFSMVSIVVFADLPMGDPETVVLVRNDNAFSAELTDDLSYPDFLDLREQSRTLDSWTAMEGAGWVLTGDGPPVRLSGFRATPNLMDVWQQPPVLGRGFLEEEARPGAPKVALLSHGFWGRQYGSSPDVLGSEIRLDGEPYTIIGVANPKLEFADMAEGQVWVPMQLGPEDRERAQRTMLVSARLRPGVSDQEATQEIAGLGQRLSETYPENREWTYQASLVKDSLLDDEARLILALLVLSVTFVLLIACANVANMLLARSTTRAREMGVRAALGARRIRLVRQLLTESFMIAVVSALAGLVLAKSLMNLLVWITAGREAFFTMAELDGHVLGFTLIVTVLAPVAFGLMPALRTSNGDVTGAIKEGGARSGGGKKASRTRDLLASGQIALALMAMVMAGLFVRTVMVSEQQEWGMDIANVMTLEMDLPDTEYADDGAIRQFYASVLARSSGVAGVESVALTNRRPSVEFNPTRIFEIEGQLTASELEQPRARYFTVSPAFLELMEIPLVRGRGIGVQDSEDAVAVAVVSAETAERFWGDADPVGQRIRVGGGEDAPWRQVVGVVADVRSNGENLEPIPTLYVPFAQVPSRRAVVLARTRVEAASVAPTLSAEVWAVDPNLPIDDTRTMERVYEDNAATTYALLTLFVIFALFALAMAGIGIYGVMAYAVSQRSSEISIRMALGAEVGKVRRMVLLQGGRIVALGGILGLLGALLVARALQSLVVGISSLDPVTFLAVPAVLLLVALIANYVPARRATSIEPMGALRVE
jgi:putative ABC transport system permease protein